MIKEMLKQIREELRDADKYVCCAKEYDDFDRIKAMYLDLASSELTHAKTICEHAKSRIDSMPQEIDNEKYVFLWEYESDMIDEEIASIMAKVNNLKVR